VSSTLERLGNFEYSKREYDQENLPEDGPYQMENKSVYTGQWKDK